MEAEIQKQSPVELFKESVNKIDNPAFLCEGSKDNPYDLKIISCNKKFLQRFDLTNHEVLRNDYDFLFDVIDTSNVSESQTQYSNLLKAVKEFQRAVIETDISDKRNRIKIGKFKVTFIPGDISSEEQLYCSFIFEEIFEKEENKEEQTIESLSHNLERALQNERILHKISRLISCDLAINKVAQDISELLREHLNVDRCILYDYNDGHSGFVAESYHPKTYSVIKNSKGQDDLNLITPYINFHHELYDDLNSNEKRSSSTMTFSDIRKDVRFERIMDIYKKVGVVSQISIITAFDSKINGGLFVQQSSPRQWTVEEIELVEMIADQFSVAIDRSFSISQVIISNQNLLEKTLELKQALKQEKDLRKMQNDFVAIVSHEFKTPLQIIDSTRELLTRKLKSRGIVDEAIEKSLTKIKSGVVRMNGLIQSTLNLSKIEMDNGDIALNKQDFDLRAFAGEIIERNHSLASDKTIRVETELSALPEIYNGDPKLLDHCFGNVITNAIKYSKPNSLVKVSGCVKDGNIIFKVVDGGIGIPKEDLQNIGKKFFRAGNTLSVSGTGIGLFLTKYFVELHNGSVLIESELGVGTTISIILPIQGSKPVNQ